MKTFYTERDIVDLCNAGVTQIEVNDKVILTDLAREKAEALGIHLKPVEKQNYLPGSADSRAISSSSAASPASKSSTNLANPELVARVKAGVIAKLGTTHYNELLDQVIPQVLARLNSEPQTSAESKPSTASINRY